MNNNLQPSSASSDWLYDSPVNSDVETKLRRFLVELGNANKILGIQVCAYKDGEVIIDTAAGVLGKDDPRPVQPDTLFPCFSATKGVTAGMVHWLADKGKLKLEENVTNFWPEFGTNGKDQIKVNHILNHTAGLHNVLATIPEDDPTLFCNFDECLKHIAVAAPETEPGHFQFYHSLSYGWLCGGIIEKASGKKFQEILEEAFVRPLNVEGEFYIGIPPGVESRLATVTIDENVISWYVKLLETTDAISSKRSFSTISNIVKISNTLDVRRAIIPGGNGQFSARALARYYATLVDGGVVPPRHSSSLPPLGSYPHNPMFPSRKTDEVETNIFNNSKENTHDAFLGRGDYKDLILPNGMFGLGFRRVKTADGSIIGFGHAGFGGSTGYCDINNRFVIGVTFNKLHSGDLTGEIVRFLCSELDLPVPQEYAAGSPE
uniref:uncharacterized protein LOC122600448 n=1 Tax=Erigeron canadensis TaxID=72917 RepID=UPI001CB944F6|nr:uncharacterized protein LOC122600448 [Erigeron canadensis]